MTGLNSPSSAAIEQGANGVLTGLSGTDLCKRLQELASKWEESNRFDVILLRALCTLSAERIQDARSGFTSVDLVQAVSQIQRRRWSDPEDPEKMSKDVRRHWATLQRVWEQKKEGIRQHALDEDWGVTPQLAKTEGGGTGRQSRYRLEWVCEAENAGSSPPPSVQDPVSERGVIQYVCEDIHNPGIMARVFARGYFLVGWRRWTFLALIGLPMLLLLGLFMLMVFQLALRQGLGIRPAADSLLTFLAIFTVFVPTLGALLMAPERKIVVAPWWMQSVYDDRLLEHRGPPRYSEKSLKIARYTAICPLCDGRVTARSGGMEFFWRIIGRCENSPQEHIFSFDHVTRRGRGLR